VGSAERVHEGDVEDFLEGITELEVTLEPILFLGALVFTVSSTSFLVAAVVDTCEDAERELWDSTTVGAVFNICENCVSEKSHVAMKA
jgi:hypothetical protein